MTVKKAKDIPWEPDPEVMKLWPDISGNTVNGLNEKQPIRPRPVFWRTDGSIPHTEVLAFFHNRNKSNERLMTYRKLREEPKAIPQSDIAPDKLEKPPEEWNDLVKSTALEMGADQAGICAYRPEWTFEDRPQPKGKWAIVMAFTHDYDNLITAPHEDAYIEVMVQYGQAGKSAKLLANWIRNQGWHAEPKMGPSTEDVLMTPAAIAAGLGQLGKHGSLINKKFGSNFRLSMVLTDIPLMPDRPEDFGSDEFCESCQICSNACPPDAIFTEKQMVRGNKKWYVNFDKCVPYFIDNYICGICIAVCPWSRPGIAKNLAKKMAQRKTAEN
jgi:epoxyqueuosine reductase